VRHLTRGHTMRRVYTAAFILSAMITALWGDRAIARGSDTEDSVRQVEHGLLPPVIVKGEPPAVSDLATRMTQLHVPGVSVAVIHGGKIAWARGFGVTRLGGPPITPDTLFQAASLSKPVTALAVMQLWERRRVDLDTDVDQYLRSWRVPDNGFTQARPVTLRELLTHTAGVTVYGFPGYEAGSPLPTVTQILDGQAPANNPPIRIPRRPRESCSRLRTEIRDLGRLSSVAPSVHSSIMVAAIMVAAVSLRRMSEVMAS
jgi:CubicO group peptidase (beta-lactamase class C family)